MNIETLTYLKDNPTLEINQSGSFSTIRGISETEITQLEQLYNNGTSFPKALRELLFLAGEYCFVLDTGWYETQQELQTAVREWLVKYNKTITRPFFAIDIYGSGEQFLYVYLDEGDDSFVYQAYLPERTDIEHFYSLNKKLSEYINGLINTVKQGYNPF
ncbi:MAG TPA: hypothetical protein VIV55_01945 [Flavobacterium sp.]